MKILQQQPVLIDIGPLDATMRMPVLKYLPRAQCDVCGKWIWDDYFIAGVQKGRRNLRFHEACIPESERKDVMSL